MKKLIIFLILVSAIQALAQEKLKTENVILITFDGLRWQELFTGADSSLINDNIFVRTPEELKNTFWANDPITRRQKLMPFFWNTVSKQGQLFGNRQYGNFVNVTNDFWFSYPGYNEILVGYKDERINSNDLIDNPNKTVLEFIHGQKGFENKVAAFGSWDAFSHIINENRSKIYVNSGFEQAQDANLTDFEIYLNLLQKQIPSPWHNVRLDAFTHHFALEHLKKHQPRVMYISYGETDDFAHDGKYDAYLQSAHKTDAFIEEIWNWVQSNEAYKNKTTLIITTDHGRGTTPKETWKDHNTKIPGSDQIWLAMIGPDIKPKGEQKTKGQYYQNQVASTLAALLGFQYKNEREVGKPISEAWKK
ncbi:MAG: sulfatase-like hydrolase/transferase [Bacteroidota bacterium]|nr:sulfatase-like hydrolase/transferase [Bacteroidota bacterium]